MMQTTASPSLSCVLPCVDRLVTFMANVPAHFSSEGAACIAHLQAELRTRFLDIPEQEKAIYGMAKLLDPRFRDLRMQHFTETADWWDAVRSEVRHLTRVAALDAPSSCCAASSSPPTAHWLFHILFLVLL